MAAADTPALAAIREAWSRLVDVTRAEGPWVAHHDLSAGWMARLVQGRGTVRRVVGLRTKREATAVAAALNAAERLGDAS